MDFGFSDEQRALYRATREFAEAQLNDRDRKSVV